MLNISRKATAYIHEHMILQTTPTANCTDESYKLCVVNNIKFLKAVICSRAALLYIMGLVS
jgi:hypothetical protein